MKTKKKKTAQKTSREEKEIHEKKLFNLKLMKSSRIDCNRNDVIFSVERMRIDCDE